MEPQAKYNVKNEKPFYEEYFSPRKKNRLKQKQHETAAIMLGYALGIILGAIIIAGLYFMGSWAYKLIQAL